MMTKKQENVKAGRNESRSDQEYVDFHEIWDSMQELCEEMMKNGEETNNYSNTMQIHDELHENFYRSKQNNEMANFDDSFLYTSQLQCKKAICAKRFTKEVSLGTKFDIESKNYVVKASKHEIRKYKFWSEKQVESSKMIYKTFKHDAAMDFVQRMKKRSKIDWER